MLGKLRVSKDEAAEGAGAADPGEEAGARAAGAGKAATTSLTSWLPGQPGSSWAQLPGHRPSKAQGTALEQVGQELLPSQAGWCHAWNALLLQPAFGASVPGDRKHNGCRP